MKEGKNVKIDQLLYKNTAYRNNRKLQNKIGNSQENVNKNWDLRWKSSEGRGVRVQQ